MLGKFFIIISDMAKKILFIADSEFKTLEVLRKEFEREYDVRILLDSKPGRSLTSVGPAITRFCRTHCNINFLFIARLTCSMWCQNQALLDGSTHTLITYNKVSNVSLLTAYMDSLIQYSSRVAIYLVVHSLEDTCTFNAEILRKRKCGHLISVLENIPGFSLAWLLTQARKSSGKL